MVDVIAQELAPAPPEAGEELTIRVVATWPDARGVVRLGRHGGFDRERVFVCDRHGARLGFDRSTWDRAPGAGASAAEWLVERDFNPGMLLAWVERWARLRSLGQGGVWIHAAAVEWQGAGWLFPAWGGAGKTDLLGAALRAGARYHADDWAPVGEDGRLYPVARRLNLLHDNWRCWPEWRRSAGPVVRAWRIAGLVGRRLPARPGRRLARVSEARLRARIAPARLFPHATAAGPVPLHHIALLVAGDRAGLTIERCDARALIPRLLACHAAERRMPLDPGALVRFARPGSPAEEESPAQRERECLARAFACADARVVTVGPGAAPDRLWRRLVAGNRKEDVRVT